MTNEELACKEFVELVTAYFERTLPAEDVHRFEAHLDDCPYCDRYLDQMRQTIRLLGRLSEEALSEEVKRDMLGRFRDWTRKQRASP